MRKEQSWKLPTDVASMVLTLFLAENNTVMDRKKSNSEVSLKTTLKAKVLYLPLPPTSEHTRN